MRPLAGVRPALMGLVMILAACGSAPTPAPPGTPPPTAAARPHSTATIQLVQPSAHAVIQGRTVHVMVALEGGQVVAQTSTNVTPDKGHVHILLDNNVVFMNYNSLEQDVTALPGINALQVEFVATDHAPFSPRVVSPQITFTVQ